MSNGMVDGDGGLVLWLEYGLGFAWIMDRQVSKFVFVSCLNSVL